MQVSLSSNFSRFSPNDSSGSSDAPARQAEAPEVLNPEEVAPEAGRSPSAEAGSTDDALIEALIEEAIALYTPVPPQANMRERLRRIAAESALAWGGTGV